MQDEMSPEADSRDEVRSWWKKFHTIYGLICITQVEKAAACSTQPHTERLRLYQWH